MMEPSDRFVLLFLSVLPMLTAQAVMAFRSKRNAFLRPARLGLWPLCTLALGVAGFLTFPWFAPLFVPLWLSGGLFVMLAVIMLGIGLVPLGYNTPARPGAAHVLIATPTFLVAGGLLYLVANALFDPGTIQTNVVAVIAKRDYDGRSSAPQIDLHSPFAKARFVRIAITPRQNAGLIDGKRWNVRLTTTPGALGLPRLAGYEITLDPRKIGER